tara:strand:+ start:102 stop:959 length:858 start_codon:yes stop_codon:yes gene_type:complete
MSNTFRRPMFRRGGEVMTGIMNNVTPRVNHATGTDYTQRLREAAGDHGGVDPLTAWLLRAGPAMMNEPKRGGTLATLARATGPATEQALGDLNTRAKGDRDIRLAGAQMGLKSEDELALQAQDAKNRQQLEQMGIDAGKYDRQEGHVLKNVVLDKFIENDMPVKIADHAADWTIESEAALIDKAAGRYGGVLEFDMRAITQDKQDKAKLQTLKSLNGKIVYDPFSQTYKMMEWKDGKPGVKFEWNSIEEILIPVAPEPIEKKTKYDSEIADKIFNIGIGQQMFTP